MNDDAQITVRMVESAPIQQAYNKTHFNPNKNWKAEIVFKCLYATKAGQYDRITLAKRPSLYIAKQSQQRNGYQKQSCEQPQTQNPCIKYLNTVLHSSSRVSTNTTETAATYRCPNGQQTFSQSQCGVGS